MSTTLEDVFQELLEQAPQPDAEILEAMARRYPQYAEELTDFAVEWALQEQLPEEEASAEAAPTAISEAMRRFRDELARHPDPSVAPGRAADPFAGHAAAELTQIAGRLGIDKTILAKLRDRKIVADTVPDELCHGLASELAVPAAVMTAHLAAPPTLPAGASFKSDRAPLADAKESFTEAVRRSFLSDEDKTRWLENG